VGESYAEAIQNLPKVHAQIEQLFHTEAQIPSNERELAIIRGALGDEVAEQVLAGQVVSSIHRGQGVEGLCETPHHPSHTYGHRVPLNPQVVHHPV